MEIFFQQLINGLTIGSLFALVALGYTMVYGVMKLINFAHGDLVAFSAFIGLSIYTHVFNESITSIIGVICVFVFTAVIIAFVGILLEELAYRPLRAAPRLSAVVSALGAGLIIQNSAMLIWGPNMKIFPSNLLPETIWEINGMVISFAQLMILLISSFLMITLYIFIHKTKIGTAIRAVSIDKDTARLMGINVNVIIITVFVVGSILGAVAGLFIGIYYRGINFNMGFMYGLNAFVAAIIGGIGSIPGAMLGGLMLGIFNAMISGYISSEWADTFTFLLLIIILIFKPTGIFGEKTAEKV